MRAIGRFSIYWNVRFWILPLMLFLPSEHLLSDYKISFNSESTTPTPLDNTVSYTVNPPDAHSFPSVVTIEAENSMIGFNYPNFNSTIGLTLIPSAAQFGNRLRLTPSSNNKVGAAWYNTKQFIEGGFETTFQFQISDLVNGGADGFAFVIQNNNISALGVAGEGMGYAGIPNSLAIEFDTSVNNNGEPFFDHISVQTRNAEPNNSDHIYSLGSTTNYIKLSDSIHTVKIVYVPGIIQIFIDNTSLLTVLNVNLATILSLDNGRAWIGFTAATAAIWENHDILSWSFSEGFNYPNFSLTTGLIFPPNGDAAQFDNKLRLTTTSFNQRGAVWYNTKQFVQGSFKTTFQFQITDIGGQGADGFAFVIQNSSDSVLGPSGHVIGYGDIANSLAIEFDTHQNDNENDPNSNHISIQSKGQMPNSANHDFNLGYTTNLLNLSDTNIHTATIEYVPGTMKIFIDDLSVPVLMASINLATKLSLDNGRAWIGFTAATGGHWENHDILSWSFNIINTPPKVYLPIVSKPPPLTTLKVRSINTGNLSIKVLNKDNVLLLSCSIKPKQNDETNLCGSFEPVGTYKFIVSTVKCGKNDTKIFDDAEAGKLITREVKCP